MTFFQELPSMSAEFHLCAQGVQISYARAQEVVEAIDSRLSSEHAQNKARMEELQRVISDRSRTETARQVARAELEELEERKFAPSAAEDAIFQDALAELERSVKDCSALREELAEAFRSAKTEMDTLRAETLGAQFGDAPSDPALMARFAQIAREKYAELIVRWGGVTQ